MKDYQIQTKKLKNKKIILLSLIAIFLVSGLLLIIYDLKGHKIKKELALEYKSDYSTDYKVYVNDNKFYKEGILTKNSQYVTSIVDHIDYDVEYSINMNHELDFEYEYNIKGKTIAENKYEGVSDIVWSKDIDFNNNTKGFLTNGTGYMINKSFTIDYKDLNKQLYNYKKSYSLPIIGYIDIDIELIIPKLKEINPDAENVKHMNIKIPLLQSTFAIEESVPESIQKSIWIEYEEESKRFCIIFQSGILALIIDAILIFIYIKLTPRKQIHNDNYYRYINKLLKKYEPIIIKINNLPKDQGLETLIINNFDDLIDIEEELRTPIIFYIKKPQKESWFFIIKDKYIYKYIVRKEDFNKEK